MARHTDFDNVLVFLRDGEYPKNASKDLRRSIRRGSKAFVYFHGKLYKKIRRPYNFSDAPGLEVVICAEEQLRIVGKLHR